MGKQAKVKPKTEEKPASSFPCDAETNAYGFLGLRKAWIDWLGWQIVKDERGVRIRVEQNADGSLTIRKA
jgi:hypothetical protein